MKYLLPLVAIVSLAFAGNAQKLKVGKKAPDFNLKTNQKTDFSLKQELASGKQVVLVFYQGKWNPSDTKYLKKLQEAKEQFEAKNTVVVLVTRESNTYSKKLKAEGIEFTVCRDLELMMMDSYGVIYKLSKKNLPDKYKSYSMENARHTGVKDDLVPVPATFVIGTDQKIKFIHFDYDYRQHPAISEILNTL